MNSLHVSSNSVLIFRRTIILIHLSSWGWAQSCFKHVEDSNKHIIEEILRQVGHLPEESHFSVVVKIFNPAFLTETLKLNWTKAIMYAGSKINSACLYTWAVHKIKLMVMECVVCSKKVTFSAAVTKVFLTAWKQLLYNHRCQ